MASTLQLTQRGGLRSRARASERATHHCLQQRDKLVAARTHAALDSFEDRLEQVRNLQFQELEALDEAGARPNSTSRFARTKSETRDFKTLLLEVHQMERTLPPRSMSATVTGNRNASRVMRPPSPLTYYDYGCVSTKPRSVHGQHRMQTGEVCRPEHRRSAKGFYFPGGHYEKGTYGFSVVDPILMASRRTKDRPDVPDRWRGDAADLRPLAAHDLSTGRNRKEGAIISAGVRPTAGHSARTKLAFHHLDKRREEAVLEQARFENGVFEGRWRDPMLDLPPGVIPEASPAADHSWTAIPWKMMNQDQVMALRLLYNINSAMRHSMGRFSDLFAKENSGPKGVLELEEFRRGLLRLGVYNEGEVSIQGLRRVVSVIDPGFDGRVNLPGIQRAVVAVRNLQEEPPPMGASLEVMEEWGQNRGVRTEPKPADYGDVAPVDAVKLNHDHGIYKFRDAFEKFRVQQRELLAHHGEL